MSTGRNRIRDLPWPEYRERIAQNPTVIIPTGACEVYGPHLPMGTDLYAADAIAERVAERTGALIAPTIELGESSALTSFSETFTVSRGLMEQYLDELMRKLIADGFKYFLFITGHASNVEIISYLVRVYMHRYDITCAQVDWWRFAGVMGEGIFEHKGYMAHGHASECGTSVMLYLHPELVRTDKITSYDPGPAANEFPDIIQYRKLKDRTPIALSGDALCATAEKGRLLIEKSVARILQYMETYFGSPTER